MAQDSIAYRLLAIGGSAGSLDTILKIIPVLPAGNHFSVVIIVHRKNDGESVLENLIAARTSLSVKEVEDKEHIMPGYIYLAPADYHLLIEDEKIFSLDASEKIHFSRPSIDVSFESVAKAFGKNSIGILLSGANADGAEGLGKIKEAGGFSIVQNPESADVGYMPQQALEQMQPDRILNGNEIADCIRNLLEKERGSN